MKTLSFSSPLDYLALMIRRKWWILIPFPLLSLAIGVITYQLPDVYVSETLILVEPREIPSDFVRDLITVDTAQRVRSVQQTLLSRTNLLRVVTEVESQLVNLQGLDDAQKVNKMKDRIELEIETRPGMTSFLRIRYQDQNPELAQKITSWLASLLIETDNRIREEQVFGTAEFLQSEFDKVSQELEQVDQALTRVKYDYLHELPNQLETNLRTLDQLHLQLQANTEAVDRSHEIRLDLEQRISQTDPEIVRQIDAVLEQLSPQVREYREKERRYKSLTNKYTEKHPDIQRVRAELEQLKSEIPPEDLIESKESDDLEEQKISRVNPIYQSLTDQLSEIKRQIQSRERERERIQAAIETYTLRVQNTPKREQEMASVVRSHNELSQQSQNLKGKLVETRLAESLESKQKGTHFVILDPANYPTTPSKPDRSMILLIGLAFSLSFGGVMAFAVDLFDQKLWTHTEVEKLLGAPVLVEVAEIISEKDLQNRKRKRRIHLTLSILAVALFCSALYYTYVHPELRALVGGYLNGLTNLAATLLSLQ